MPTRGGSALTTLTPMDLHVVAPIASPAERAAVDAVLDPIVGPRTGWTRRRPRHDGREPHRPGRPRGAGPPRPAPARAPRRPGPDRLHQPAGPRLRLPAPDDPARRGLRRGHLLHPVRHDRAAPGGGSRLRRHRLPAGRRRGALRRARAIPRSGRRAGPRRTGDLAPEPLPRPLRAGARGAVHGGRRRSALLRRGPGRCRRHPGPPRGGREPSTIGRGAPGRPPYARPATRPSLRSSGPPRDGPPIGAPGRPGRPPPPGPGRRRRSDEPGRLPRSRRLPGPRPRHRAGPDSGDRGGHRGEAHGSRRGRLPDRAEVGRGRRPAGPAPLPGLQRRRIGAGNVQGPGPPRGRPLRDDRGDDHRRLRHGRRASASCTCAASTRSPRSGWPGPSRRRGPPDSSGRTSWGPASPSTSSCAGAPAPTSAARRRPSSSRSRASAASRATSRRSRSRSACSASRPRSTTSRPWPTSRRSSWTAGRPSRRSAPTARPVPSSSACPVTSPGRASTRSRSGRPSVSSWSWPAAWPVGDGSGRSSSAGPPASSSAPTRSTRR